VVDIVLLAGKVLFLILLYLFLFAAVRTGVGLVGDRAPRQETWRLGLAVKRGPSHLRGIKLDLGDRVSIGRSPDADLVIQDEFVSSHQARIDPTPKGPVIVDLDSTNGTFVNDARIDRPTRLDTGDVVEIGEVVLEVERL
jgi:hypothetical protein